MLQAAALLCIRDAPSTMPYYVPFLVQDHRSQTYYVLHSTYLRCWLQSQDRILLASDKIALILVVSPEQHAWVSQRYRGTTRLAVILVLLRRSWPGEIPSHFQSHRDSTGPLTPPIPLLFSHPSVGVHKPCASGLLAVF